MEKKYEQEFLNPEGFTPKEIEDYRGKVMVFLRAFGGRRLAIPLSDNLDLNHKKKVAGDMPGLYLGNPLKKYYIETVDLFAANPRKLANGKVVIEFNNDPKLQFDLRSDIDNHIKATAADVNEAILKYEATGEKSFFWNVKMVTECVTALNQSNLNEINNFIDQLGNDAAALESLSKLIKDDTAAYYKSIGE